MFVSVSSTPTAFGAIAYILVAYIPVQRFLRHRRERKIIRKYGYRQRSDLARMTMDEAGEILREVLELEMTDAFEISLGYGFLQTLAFPDSSALLAHTKQINNPDQSDKRLFDTSQLMNQILSYTPSSDRFRAAISRINYIHSRYGDRITNEQLVYVLAVFACNPWIWADEWEWRKMNDLEIAAQGTFWLGVGQMMHINMDEIKGAGKADPRYLGSAPNAKKSSNELDSKPQQTWADGLDWMLDMRAYMRVQEERSLGNSPDVESLVEETFRMILAPLPRLMEQPMRQIVSVMFEKRFREVSGVPEPPKAIETMVIYLRLGIKYFRRYLGLPRPSFLTNRMIAERPDPATGLYQVHIYDAYPYYVKPTLWKRWNPIAILRFLSGGDRPGDKPEKYHPEGYKVDELGPPRWQGKGKDWMADDVKRGREVVSSGGTCPFGFTS